VSDIQCVWVFNPNCSTSTTERLQSKLSPLAPFGTELSFFTARFGAPYIACEASHAIAGHALLDAWTRQLQTTQNTPDRVLIGCFGDPGLFALRESSACPVTGLAEASFIQAAQTGPFAIVTGGERWKPMLYRLAQSLGFEKNLLHIETVRATGAELQSNPEAALDLLANACQRATLPGVQSIILGGAGLAGYAAKIQHRCRLPLIDSVEAGLCVLLQNTWKKPERLANGFETTWVGMPELDLNLPK
jgi:allantoin racemase